MAAQILRTLYNQSKKELSMKKLLFLSLSLFFILSIVGCGGGDKPLPKTDTGNVPEWFMNPPEDPNYVFSAKTSTSKDMQLALDKATTDARAEIARTIEVRIQGFQKKFDEEVGVGQDSELLQMFTQATKTVVSQSLSGSKVEKKHVEKDGNNWRAYVLVSYPIGAANQALVNQIKQQQNMYTRFRASQAFEELEKEAQKFEEWKEKQK